MVSQQLRGRGIRDERVLEAMSRVPRELFVPQDDRAAAYSDRPLPIGDKQTISQPYIVARMCELAEVGERDTVLDVGCGSGYQTAVLAMLAERVIGIEIQRSLAQRAERALAAAGVHNAEIRCADGGYGAPDAAPFAAILIAAAARRAPVPLVDQLADGGRLVMPLGGRWAQELVRFIRRSDALIKDSHGGVRFVAFVGDYGR